MANRSTGSGEVFIGVYYIWASPPSWSCDQAQLYNFFFHYSQKLSHDIWFQITQQFFRKIKFKFENGVTFVEGQIMTLTFDIHLTSLNHLVQCSYQL